jgi:hypothetical protein
MFTKNLRTIPENSLLANDMTEAEFKKIAKDFEQFFSQSIEAEYNSELIIFSSWKASTINAYAEQDPGKFMITIYGGLARHKSMTADSTTLTLCHELGHHLGGYPKKSTNKWSSAEGQADYYATMKCGRKIWEKENNEAAIAHMTIPAALMEKCDKVYSTNPDRALCVRMNMAGRGLALMFQDLESDSLEPRFETPSQEIARAMNFMHPYNQCRLDTYFQGSLCHVDKSVNFDDDKETIGACHPKLGDKLGNRPACWFLSKN